MQKTTPLREKFRDFMLLKRFSDKTIEAYIHAVAGLAQHYSCPPDRLNLKQVQDYLLYLLYERKLSWSSCNVALSAFCCFFNKMLRYEGWKYRLPPRPRVKQLPMLLSKQEVKRLINAPDNLKHRAMLYTVYGSGVRVRELTRLKVQHIESGRNLIRVEQGKGRKDRYTLLGKPLLRILRDYWRAYHPTDYLFPGKEKTVPITVSSVQRVYYRAKARAGIDKGRGIHTLRHCFASHLLSDGTDIYTLKRLLGHRSIKTTWRYCHVSQEDLLNTPNPLTFLEQR